MQHRLLAGARVSGRSRVCSPSACFRDDGLDENCPSRQVQIGFGHRTPESGASRIVRRCAASASGGFRWFARTSTIAYGTTLTKRASPRMPNQPVVCHGPAGEWSFPA